jgi:hypothetical protein
MNHTAGVRDDWDEDTAFFLRNPTDEDFLKALYAFPLKLAAGQGWAYGAGPFVLGVIIEKISGKQEGQHSLVVEGRILAIHSSVPCLRYHHLGFALEAAFEFGRDEKEQRGASLSRHQECLPGQLPQIPTVEGRHDGGHLSHHPRSSRAASSAWGPPRAFFGNNPNLRQAVGHRKPDTRLSHVERTCYARAT